MKFYSSRNTNYKISLHDAIKQGLAADSGLFIPEHFPEIDLTTLINSNNYVNFATEVLNYFFKNDPLEPALNNICTNAFNFPIPLKKINDTTFLLELFHGPTLSFKDFGARFLAECLANISSTNTVTILVATSGDTGSAVASAFYDKPHINVVVFYPKGQISKRQEHQIICWGKNILALAVDGSFDDCQQLVKTALNEKWWQPHTELSTANSINMARLLPQVVFYAYTSTQFFKQYQRKANFIVPSGNLGNVTAAFWAKKLGFAIDKIVLATNANKVISDYLNSGNFIPRPSITTLANAMDVGNPSNFERLENLFPNWQLFKNEITAKSVNDEEIKHAIMTAYKQQHLFICPHTATAFFTQQFLDQTIPWIVVATADACKFETVIEPILQTKIPVAPQMAALLKRPSHYYEIQNDPKLIQQKVREYFNY